MSAHPIQLELRPRTWGGRRPGAGRKASGRKVGVAHRPRPAHVARHPLHVTLRAGHALPSLRSDRLFVPLRRGLARASRGGFRIPVLGPEQSRPPELPQQQRRGKQQPEQQHRCHPDRDRGSRFGHRRRCLSMTLTCGCAGRPAQLPALFRLCQIAAPRDRRVGLEALGSRHRCNLRFPVALSEV